MSKIGAAAGFEVLLHDHDLFPCMSSLCCCGQAGCAAADHEDVAAELRFLVWGGSLWLLLQIINRSIMAVLGTGATGNALVCIDLVFGEIHPNGASGTVQLAGMTSGTDILVNVKRHMYSPFPFITDLLYSRNISVTNAVCAVTSTCENIPPSLPHPTKCDRME